MATRPLLLVCVLASVGCLAHADPLGTIGGPADSLLRVQTLEGWCSPSVMCTEAIGILPYADYSLNPDAQLYATGLVDHAAGEVEGLATYSHGAGKRSGGDFWIHVRDRFTVSGPADGETVEITGKYRVIGSITFNGSSNLVSASVEALVSSRSNGWNSQTGGIASSSGGALYSTGINPGEEFIPYSIEASDTFDVVTGTPFQFVYVMRLGGASAFGGAGGATLDSLNTGQLSFELPAGYSITSELGYTSGAVTGPGDANGDGVVDILDLDILSAHFGSAMGAAVPEPSVGLAVAAVLFCAASQRTGRS